MLLKKRSRERRKGGRGEKEGRMKETGGEGGARERDEGREEVGREQGQRERKRMTKRILIFGNEPV